MSSYVVGWMDDRGLGKRVKTEPILSINLIFSVKLEKTAVTQFIVEHFHLWNNNIQWEHSLRATNVNNSVSATLMLLHTMDMNRQNIQFLFLYGAMEMNMKLKIFLNKGRHMLREFTQNH